MKKNPLSYYLVNKHQLLVNQEAYAQIQRYIYYAHLTHYQDVVVLDYRCSQKRSEETISIRYGKVVSPKEACSSCLNRLKMLTGNECMLYKSIKKEKSEDFSYLIPLLNEKNAVFNQELAWYVALCTDEVNTKPYKEYHALLSFFSKLNDWIETLHRMRSFFRKRFR